MNGNPACGLNTNFLFSLRAFAAKSALFELDTSFSTTVNDSGPSLSFSDADGDSKVEELADDGFVDAAEDEAQDRLARSLLCCGNLRDNVLSKLMLDYDELYIVS